VAAAIVLVLGTWLASSRLGEPARFHHELGISPDVEEAIVRNLDLLQALERDARLLENAEFLLELDRQLRSLEPTEETAS